MNQNIVITRDTQKRLVADIRNISQSPLTKHGIYYVHDEVDMLKGYALIIGPSDSIYADGFFFFEWFFPYNYPFSPPKILFRTYDGFTRFHPNLYKNGKVCLSLLNTWKGEQWTSCQTISSILLTLITLFHNKPLLNEPGFTEQNRDFKPYNEIIEYRNYKSAINGIVSQSLLPPLFLPFFPFIKKHFTKEYKNIINRLTDIITKKPVSETISVNVYNMKEKINYKAVLEDVKIICTTLNLKLK